MILIDWSYAKQILDKGAQGIVVEDAERYICWTYSGGFVTKTNIEKVDDPDLAEFLTYKDNIKSPITDKGYSKTSIYEPEGSFLTIATHDWTDPTTWYTASVRITGEVVSGAGVTYTLANPNVINLNSGKVSREDDFSAPYLPVVYDNGVQVSNWTLDHSTGVITFDSAPSGPVTADYSYATTSDFHLIPSPGKSLRINHAEIQFTQDVVTQPTIWQVWAYNPLDLPNKVPVATTKYKSLKDIINICNLGQGSIPVLTEIGQPVIVFPFDYARAIDLDSSKGMELRMKISNDIPMSGTWATVTFYTVEDDL